MIILREIKLTLFYYIWKRTFTIIQLKKFLLAIALMASSYGVHAQEAVSPLNKGNWLYRNKPFSFFVNKYQWIKF